MGKSIRSAGYLAALVCGAWLVWRGGAHERLATTVLRHGEATPAVPHGPMPAGERRTSSISALPPADRLALEIAIARSRVDLAPQPDQGGFVLRGSSSVGVRVDARGAELRFGSVRARMTATALGRRGAELVGFEPSPPSALEYDVVSERAPGVTEIWRRLERGIEHAFRVDARPDGAGELALRMTLDGPVSAFVREGRVLFDAGGRRVGSYEELLVFDSTGRVLPSRFEADGGVLTIVYDDEGARYPVVVDPMLLGLEQKISASDAAANDLFGVSVAISADGSRAVVGASGESDSSGTPTTGNGALYVYVRTGSTWTQEQKLLAPDKFFSDALGSAVAIDDDGTRIVGGANGARVGTTTAAGAAYVFVRSGSAWTFEQKLTAGTPQVQVYFGTSVDISGDGSRIVVGEPGPYTTWMGAAYVFSRSGTSWASESTITNPSTQASQNFGQSVAMSGDGSRVAVGAPDQSESTGTPTSNNGAAFVFSRTVTTWNVEQKLLAPDRTSQAEFGISVDLDQDGSRVAVGARSVADTSPPFYAAVGAGYVFTRSGVAWTVEQKLMAANRGVGDRFGSSISLSRDGTHVAICASAADRPSGSSTYTGSAYVFSRNSTAWSEAQELSADDLQMYAGFGRSISITLDGSRVVVGADSTFDVGGTIQGGAAYIYAPGLIGAPCSTGSDCANGICADGVCCTTSCGGSAPDDCQACSRALTGLGNGTCAGLSASVAQTVVCRASIDACDAAETCVAGNTSCPADAIAASSVTCRASAGSCDPAETCDGVGIACPADARTALGTPCRPSVGICDVAEDCDGAGVACPVDAFSAASVVCRASSGPCDVDELCTGSGNACPADAVAGAATVCRVASGTCEYPALCNGTLKTCPANTLLNAGTECRGANGSCDVAESCTGSSGVCPANVFVVDGTTCDDGLACSQSSSCQTGTCAPALTLDCSDGDPCTTDVCAEPSGCSHTVVASCIPDGGTDASVGSDAGLMPAAVGGCSCRVVPARTGARAFGWCAPLVVVVLAFVRAGARRTRPG